MLYVSNKKYEKHKIWLQNDIEKIEWVAKTNKRKELCKSFACITLPHVSANVTEKISNQEKLVNI